MTKLPIACIVLPTYNEAGNIPVVIPQIFEQGTKFNSHDLHVLVVDDSSPDGTAEVVREMQKKYKNLHLINGEKNGLGEAYKRGMAHASDQLNAEVIFQMDADLQHDPAMLPLFITLYNFGFTFVIGSRFAPGGTTVNFSFYRTVISRVGNFLIRVLGGLPRLNDFTSGYRCIKADLLKKCDLNHLSTRGYSFQTSLAFELLRNGAKVLEIPIIFREREHGASKLAFRDQFEFVINLARIRFGKYYDFVRYMFIGFAGVLVNLGIYIIAARGLNIFPEVSALISIEASIVFNFLMNNLWNIRKSVAGKHWFPRLIRFHKKTIPGAVVTYVVFLLLIANQYYQVPALAAGIFIGVFVNYIVDAYFTWRHL